MRVFRRGLIGNVAVRAPAAGGGGSAATYVSSASYNTGGSSGTLALPASVAAGDIAFVSFVEGGTGAVTSPGDGGASWTLVDQEVVGSFTMCCWKRTLTANDVSNGNFSFSGTDNFNTIGVSVWRGATTATLKETGSDNGTSTSIALTGFSPNGSSKGVLLISQEWNYGDQGVPAGIAATGFTSRLNSSIGPNNTVAYALDQLSGYAGGGISVTGYTRAAFGFKAIWAIELT